MVCIIEVMGTHLPEEYRLVDATTIRSQARKRLDRLSGDRLQVADDFLACLEERESREATGNCCTSLAWPMRSRRDGRLSRQEG